MLFLAGSGNFPGGKNASSQLAANLGTLLDFFSETTRAFVKSSEYHFNKERDPRTSRAKKIGASTLAYGLAAAYFRVVETVLLANRHFAGGIAAIFVIFVDFRGLRSKSLVFFGG